MNIFYYHSHYGYLAVGLPNLATVLPGRYAQLMRKCGRTVTLADRVSAVSWEERKIKKAPTFSGARSDDCFGVLSASDTTGRSQQHFLFALVGSATPDGMDGGE